MIIFKKFNDYTSYLLKIKNDSKQVGFVPTMGALHNGHISLINLSKENADLTVASIFVNPTQFTNLDDFKKYPATLENDILLLEQNGCDILLVPDREEVYPPDYTYKPIDLGNLEFILEGAFRPGHFQGVCQVVKRLIEIVEPQLLFLGQKDYQQCKVIELLLKSIDNAPEIITGETVREPSGLAMSSRNKRLTDQEKENATAIYKCLVFIKESIKTLSLKEIKEICVDMLKEKGFITDYIEIVTADNLMKVENIKSNEPLIALIAASISGVRLIDNLKL